MNHLSIMLSNINSGYKYKQFFVKVPYSSTCFSVLKLLYKEGFIHGFSLTKKNKIFIKLKFYENSSLWNQYIRISKPGRRVYLSSYYLNSYFNKKSFVLVSTNKGFMWHKDAILKNIGGEVIFGISYC